MKYQEKKQGRKTKYEEKEKPPTKFNFVYDEQNVTFKTQIPELPEKLMSKPNEKNYLKKVADLEKSIEELKEQRKKKKAEYKAGTKNYSEEIEELKYKINLGKKCLLVLNFDIKNLTESLIQVQGNMQESQKVLNDLKKNPRKKEEIQDDQMTYNELQREIQRLSVRISTASLTKKQENQINARIGKLNRLKMTAPKGSRGVDESQIEENKKRKEANENLRKQKRQKENIDYEIKEINNKIQSIQEDVEQFQDNLSEIQKRKEDPEISGLYEESQDIKKKIYDIREELGKVHEQYIQNKYSYDYEQEKIKWVKWAKQIKDSKVKQWEEEKAEKRKQKMFKQKKNTDKQNEKQTAEGGKKEFEKPKINKHQKEIDACTFLINYCQKLVPEKEGTAENARQNKINVEDELKKGEWAKMKGVQIIQSKKNKNDEEKEKKVSKKGMKEKRDEVVQEDPNKVTHDFFVGNIFDSVNVVPPTKVEDIEKTVGELKEKLDYYLAHPQGPTTKPEKSDKEKKYTAEKYAKAKNQNKKIINTEDFPSLD